MRLIDVDATKFRCRYDKVCSCDNKDKCKSASIMLRILKHYIVSRSLTM